jgi:hypothetical protein
MKPIFGEIPVEAAFFVLKPSRRKGDFGARNHIIAKLDLEGV